MRYAASALLFFTALSPLSVAAGDFIADSKVTAATVYMNRAGVTRSAKIEIPAGSHTVILNGLPLNIDVNSLRANGTAKGKVSFGAVSHKRQSSKDFVHPKEQELNNILMVLKDQKKGFEAEKKSLKIGREFLENLGKQAALREDEEIAKIELNPERWASVADSLSLKTVQFLKNEIALDGVIRETNDNIRKVQKDLNQLRTGQKQTYTVQIPVESETKTTLSLDLEYQISNVGWNPVYDARLETKTGKLDLVQYGSVWQRTGEDWSGVKLTLSTAQPSRGASLPELYPRWVNVYDPKVMKQARSLGVANFAGAAQNKMAVMSAPMAMESAADMAMPEAIEEQVEVRSANINTEGFVGEYEIIGPSDVKSDGTQSKVLIGSFDVGSRLQVQIKPQYDATQAYLVALATLKGDAPILPGQVNLFRDGAFIGQDHIAMMRQGDETDLGFGIDDNVTVSRNTLKDERSETGMITKDNVLERHYVTKVKNLHKKPIEIAFFETIPASKDERVRIEILNNATSKGYEKDINNKKGVTGWVYEVQPQEETEINLGWKVSWPKGVNLSGL